ncbi:MAG: hypothetical protein WC635_14680 [Bacteriovorax sp.]|jgi:hypothetical protein
MAIYKSHTNIPVEIDHLNSHALISYRSIVAGLLVSVFTMIGLIGLGLAVGGISMDAETSAKSAGIFSGIWFLVSTIFSLFAGSYFAARVSKYRAARIGSAQGLVIASVFLGVFLYQTFAIIGTVGSAAGKMIGKAGNIVVIGANQASSNTGFGTTINNMTEDALGDLNLKDEPSVVAQGLGSRLLRRDINGAKNYLAYQAGLTPAEADARIATMRARVDKAVIDAKEGAAVALRSTGWTLFSLVILGAAASTGGGAMGSAANFRKPIIKESVEGVPYGHRV